MKIATSRVRAADVLAMLAILAFIALVYLPVGRAEFIWDDKTAFHDEAWLRNGDHWWGFLRRGFSGWINYFRPLVVALFKAQISLFGASPAAMHYVSLGLHLINTLLVGLLAIRFVDRDSDAARARAWVAAAMLLYGLHPALIEPVVWISCQYELTVTLFVLLALHANVSLQRAPARALVTGTCFFLAACAKESAAALPLLLLIHDWYASGPATTRSVARIKAIWDRQKFVYLALLLAGAAYLLVRYEALGFLLAPSGNESLWSFARLQKACYTYLAYWRLCLWPMQGLGPLHVVDMQRFSSISAAALAVDAGAILIALAGCYWFVRRKPIGNLMMSFGAGLIAVLNIVPVAFVESIYHERYLMTALAVACAWLPCSMLAIRPPRSGPFKRTIDVAGLVVVPVWLGLALLNIHLTLPLWADEMSLWQWALRQDPQSVIAKEHLMTEYMARSDYVRARAIADELVAAKAQCPYCMLNAAYLALDDGDLPRAATALDGLKQGNALAFDNRLLHGFILASAEMAELKHDDAGAEDAYRDAITSDPDDPSGYARMALFLARAGRADEARKMEDAALSLYAPDERPKQMAAFERASAAATPRSESANPSKP